MRRRGGRQRFLDRCRLVQQSLDLPAITTDIIVGFPGETEDDFRETLDLATEVGMAKIHAFSYSPRRGTDAASFSDQVPATVKAERYARLSELDRQLQRTFQNRLLGQRLDVLLEAPVAARAGWMQGTACRAAQVWVPGDLAQRRQLITVSAVERVDLGAGELDATALIGQPLAGSDSETGKAAVAPAV
jgi:threonylcarbamoyladenosine tRNA methylthiotransferase MtaB